ncbi:MAG: Urease accessory protein UreD [Betaproteobacteria bacterium]|nr:Urease accessory protein UreD [Betaproteobacteria bacterium]
MLLADPVHVRGWRAELALQYERRGARTVLASRRHEGPLVVQKPLYPEGDGVCHTILIHPPGGLAGGDDLEARAALGADSHVLLTTPAAGKWYRSLGPAARQRVAITAGAGACAEWLPQETILFDGARARIETDVRLTATASYIGWDIVCLGRTASGERYETGECRLHTRIARDDRTLWLERGAIEAGGRLATSPAGLAGHTVFATMLATLDAARDLLDACRSEIAEDGATGITCPPGLFIARYLGDSSEAARRYFQKLWALIRPAVTGREAHTPRIWST